MIGNSKGLYDLLKMFARDIIDLGFDEVKASERRGMAKGFALANYPDKISLDALARYENLVDNIFREVMLDNISRKYPKKEM